MSGNETQYDPTKIFQDWIQKGGKAQADFIKVMSSAMSKDSDPMKSFGEIASNAQSNLAQSASDIQSKGFNEFLKMGQMVPNFLNWGAYKTSIGSNGRISIPEAERNALGLSEGDLVQVIVFPVPKKLMQKEVKQ